ncbi:hypothetical protein [Bradyrhizobium sp. USDA 4454]
MTEIERLLPKPFCRLSSKAAKAFDLTVPLPLLAVADEMIEWCTVYAALHESGNGPARTFTAASPMSAFEGDTDLASPARIHWDF